MQFKEKLDVPEDIKYMSEHVLPGLILDLIITSLGRAVT